MADGSDVTTPDRPGARARPRAEDADAPIDDALAAARPDAGGDDAALVLARARVASALFGDAAPGLGRFRVLERLGGGGMGIVYAAYDPQLDRGVALKTIHLPTGARELALHEAKALAKLSHPNIVPVFEVGFADEHVYIVMELVRGETLRAYAPGKPLAQILDVYRQAALALAAAHAANLVHRDFKPDNAIVGTDGRVRVVDFGLACESSADPATGTRAAGTPRYMAPEQAAGAAVTAAADQYSFAIALAEALDASAPGEPLPRWLAAIVERGSAADAAARFASMTELSRALARDPARVRRRRVAIAAIGATVAAASVAAFALGARHTGAVADEPAPCSGADAELATAWKPADRDARVAAIASLSAYGKDLAPKLATALAAEQTAYVATARDACLAHRSGALPDAAFERRAGCLDRARASLAAVADIARDATAQTLPEVARAASALADPTGCADPRAAADLAPPPAATAARVATLAQDLERDRVQIAAGRLDDARGLADKAVATARGLAYPPALASALLELGHANVVAGDDAASAQLGEAMATAVASADAATAVEAWARRAWFDGTSDHPGDALAGLDVVEALAARTPGFPRALLHNNVGSVLLARGDRAGARAQFLRALDDARAIGTGPGSLELLATRGNIALVEDDVARRDQLLAEADAAYAKLLGAHHPDTLASIVAHVGIGAVEYPHARDLLADACPAMAEYGLLARAAGECFVELADLAAELGDRTGAAAASARAVALFGVDIPRDVLEVPGYAALWRGDQAAAVSVLAEALAIPSAPDAPWFIAVSHAKVDLALGRALPAGSPRALALLAEAVAALTPIVRDHPQAAYARRLARARAEYARALAVTGRRTEAAAVARDALTWLEPARAPAVELAALRTLAR